MSIRFSIHKETKGFEIEIKLIKNICDSISYIFKKKYIVAS